MKLIEQIEKVTGTHGGPLSLGVIGGTFDPIHTGHLYCAEQARAACGLDAVVFVPAGRSPFKLDRQQAPFADRMMMCELAVSSNPCFFASDIESDESRAAYTVETIESLKRQLPDEIDLAFITGSDAAGSLHLWKDAEKLAALCRFICVSRNRGALDDESGCRDGELDRMGFEVQDISAPMLDISSSDIRERIRNGRSIRYIVPDPVRDYIYSNGLYKAERKL